MNQSNLTTKNSLQNIQWMWQSNLNPWSTSETAVWTSYSNEANLIIEKAFSNSQNDIILGDYCINFQDMIQISISDITKRRPIKRQVNNN